MYLECIVSHAQAIHLASQIVVVTVVVTLAEHDGVPVARKHTDDGASDGHVIAREAELLASLRHPGVVELVHHDPETGMVTAFAGQPLRQVAGVPLTTAAGIVATAAHTVAELHAAGLAHGALDVSHVLVGSGGTVRLCGFSSAGPATPEAMAADVAGLGELLRHLVGDVGDGDPIPERRLLSWRSRSDTAERRALLTLADQAAAEHPGHRPPARRFADLLTETVPEAPVQRARVDLVLPAMFVGRESNGVERQSPTDGRETEVFQSGNASEPISPDQTPTGCSPEVEPLPESPASVSTSPKRVENDPSRPAEAAATIDEGTPVQPPAAERPAAAGVVDVRARDVTRQLGGRAGNAARTTRSRRAVAAGVAAVGVVVVGLGLLRLVEPDRPSLTSSSAPLSPDTTLESATTTTTAPTPSTAPDLTAPTAPAPQGCATCVDLRIDGNVITVGDESYQIGREGDITAVGDWDCDGEPSPALLRPSTGDVFVFPGWTDDELIVRAVDRISGAADLRVDGDERGCDVLVVVDTDGRPTVVVPS